MMVRVGRGGRGEEDSREGKGEIYPVTYFIWFILSRIGDRGSHDVRTEDDQSILIRQISL
jgi:hypothetical protein